MMTLPMTTRPGALLVGLLLALVGCGAGSGPMAGTWRMSAQSATYDVVLSPAGWDVGGGCIAPLTRANAELQLTTTNWACMLSSGAGLPQTRFSSYAWKTGDVLVVRDARFELLAGDKLHTFFDTQIRTNTLAPDVGPVVMFRSDPGQGLDRVP